MSEAAVSGMASGAAAGTSIMPGWGTVIGAGLGLIGGMMNNDASADAAERSNQQNWEMFEANAQFQQRMASNAYQWRVEDLKKAGLNPMLAIGGPGGPVGGGGTAPAVTPQFKNVGEAAASAAAAMRADELNNAQIDLLRAQTAAQGAQANSSSADAARKTFELEFDKAQTGFSGNDATNYGYRWTSEIKKLFADYNLSTEQQKMLEQTRGREDLVREVLRSEAFRNKSSGSLDGILTRLRGFDVPGAQARAASDSTFWGREVRPYLPDVGALSNSAGSLARIWRDMKGARDLDWKQGGMTNTRTGEMTTRQRAR